MNSWIDTLLQSDQTQSTDTLQSILFTFLLAFVIGQVIGWVYQRTHRGLSYSQSFAGSMVVLPVLVAMMMLLISDSFSIAFGLLAVFAVVRFRNVLKDTRDTIFVLWSIIEGMAAGTGHASLAVVGVISVATIMFYLGLTDYGARQRYDTIISLFCVGTRETIVELVDGVLRRHCLTSQLASTEQVDANGFDISYRLTLRDPARRHELESELRGLERVSRVSVFAHDDESEV